MMKLPATFDGYSSRSDASLGLRFSTQEMADTSIIHAHVRQFGWLLFSENEIQSGDIPKERPTDNKTPSKRLRDVLYVLHVQQKGTKETFEPFYQDHMEKLITFIKGKLEPE
jgi:hypothetical protein